MEPLLHQRVSKRSVMISSCKKCSERDKLSLLVDFFFFLNVSSVCEGGLLKAECEVIRWFKYETFGFYLGAL